MVTKTDDVHEEELRVEEGNGVPAASSSNSNSMLESCCSSPSVVTLTQKVGSIIQFRVMISTFPSFMMIYICNFSKIMS